MSAQATHRAVPTRRRGIALLMALCTLALLGAMVATTLHTVGELRRGASRLASLERARFAAERAMMLAVAQSAESLAVGERRRIELADGLLWIAPDEHVEVWVTALPGGVRRFTARAVAGHGSRTAEQGVYALATRQPPTVEVKAALAAGSTVTIAAGWDVHADSGGGCGAGDGLPLVQLPSLTQLHWAGEAPAGAVVEGVTDAAGVLSGLRRHAGEVLPPGAALHPGPKESAGLCVADADNWGSDAGPCAERLPVVFATGDLRLTGGEGQGVLLVSGDLMIEGAFRYSGLIVVGGSVVVSMPSSKLHGAIIVSGAADLRDAGSLAGSRCAVMRALAAAARWEPLTEWGWGGIR